MSVDNPSPTMIELEVTVTAEACIEALRAAGAMVVWQGPARSSATEIELNVTADADEVYEALPGWMLNELREEEWTDARDVGDFVTACFGHDRATAMALLPRLGLSDVRTFACEQTLLRAGGLPQ